MSGYFMKYRVVLLIAVVPTCLFSTDELPDFIECKRQLYQHRVTFTLKNEYQVDHNAQDGLVGWNDLDSLMVAEGALTLCHEYYADHPEYLSNRIYSVQFSISKDVRPIVKRLLQIEKIEMATVDSIPEGLGTVPAKIKVSFNCGIDMSLCNDATSIGSEGWGNIKQLEGWIR